MPGDDDDIFQHGCDSLQATWIRNSILHASTNSQNIDLTAIPTNFVYSNPTVRMLAEMLAKLAEGGISKPQEISRRANVMEVMVKKYTHEFPQHMATTEAQKAQVVLVTGTTGALGSHILTHLLALPDISMVYALNRPPSNLRERQSHSFEKNGIDTHLVDSSKLRLLTGDLNAPRFDLSAQDFDTLRESVTLVVHNGWQVNFNVSLSTMEPLVAGTRQLIDFALASPHPSPPRLIFVSSAGVFRKMNESNTALESPISDPRISVGLGYTESKWVTERVLEIAAQMSVLSPVIVRPGQLSGASNGAWNASDWFPVLMRSSQLSGHLPIISGRISWIPIHHAAKALVEVRNSQERYLHINHPNPVPMEHILSPLSKILGIPLVPYAEWLEALEASASRESGASVDPAVRLIDFFRSYREVAPDQEAFFPAVLSNAVAVRSAPSLSLVSPLTAEDVEGWTSYLRQAGYLS
ncbi:male sterility protein-domain-containing protein [Mycena maculata]|uniref:Male sterility protein-domain-containing protein n=1 Tax=Mycena maculata TaxID=230809 RepID=A0AAD7K0J5_9AGAR|nr:male sterility protein-domain-containing protein [Mycena maculata]